MSVRLFQFFIHSVAGSPPVGGVADLISLLQPSISQQMPKRSFPLDYKLQIVEESKLSSVHAVAKAHGITGKCIQRWRKQEDQLREALVSGRMYNSGGQNRKTPKKKTDTNPEINPEIVEKTEPKTE